MAALNNNCLQYYVRLDEFGYGIPGTMQGFQPNNPPCGAICDWALLPTTQMTVPDADTQCRQANGLRYFYRFLRTTPITLQPNSFISAYTFPTTPNDCQWLEWFKICPNT